jgi:hypothetical protein
VIGQRPVKLTKAQEKHAYDVATERDQGRCVRCGSGGVTQRDHRQNRTAYNTTPANLQLLCVACHRWKTENPKDAASAGFAVSRWADPTQILAYRHDVGWVKYDNDGGWTPDEIPF